MKAYKLLRKLSDGKLYPLFIHKTFSTPFGEWMQAECYPTKGFAIRKGWHCTFIPLAPHLSIKLANGENVFGLNVKLRIMQLTIAQKVRVGRGFSPSV